MYRYNSVSRIDTYLTTPMNYTCKYHNFKHQQGGLRGKDANQQQFYARMASVPYSSMVDRQAKMNKYGFNDWIQDTSLSNRDVSVLYNPKTKEVVSAVAGTRINDKKNKYRDLRSDLGIIAGVSRFGSRNTEVKKVVLDAKNKYKDYDMVITGHSLGGKISQNISKSTGIPAVTFNAGSSPIDAIGNKLSKMFGADNKDSEVIHYTTNSIENKTIDPLSLSSAVLKDANETISVKKTTDDGAHSLSQFGAGKKKSAWMIHVAKIKVANPGKPYSAVLKLASTTYKK